MYGKTTVALDRFLTICCMSGPAYLKFQYLVDVHFAEAPPPAGGSLVTKNLCAPDPGSDHIASVHRKDGAFRSAGVDGLAR